MHVHANIISFTILSGNRVCIPNCRVAVYPPCAYKILLVTAKGRVVADRVKSNRFAQCAVINLVSRIAWPPAVAVTPCISHFGRQNKAEQNDKTESKFCCFTHLEALLSALWGGIFSGVGRVITATEQPLGTACTFVCRFFYSDINIDWDGFTAHHGHFAGIRQSFSPITFRRYTPCLRPRIRIFPIGGLGGSNPRIAVTVALYNATIRVIRHGSNLQAFITAGVKSYIWVEHRKTLDGIIALVGGKKNAYTSHQKINEQASARMDSRCTLLCCFFSDEFCVTRASSLDAPLTYLGAGKSAVSGMPSGYCVRKSCKTSVNSPSSPMWPVWSNFSASRSKYASSSARRLSACLFCCRSAMWF